MSMKNLSLFLFLYFSCIWADIVIRGCGGPAFAPLLQDWFYAYRTVKPDVRFNFTLLTNSSQAVRSIVDFDSNYDFASIDGNLPSNNDYQKNSDIQVIPYALTALVPQINVITSAPVILVEQEVLAQIFMGNITQWNDPAIQATNKNVKFPNATIIVFYRSETVPANALFTAGLAHFSPEFARRYGVNQTFPSSLRGLPNFRPASTSNVMNGLVLSTPNSIGYCSQFLVARDRTMRYARIGTSMNDSVGASSQEILAGMENATLDTFLRSPRPHALVSDPNAWPFADYISLLVPTNPTACPQAREFYKFVKWALTDAVPVYRAAQSGFSHLSANVTKVVLNRLSQIKCGGQSISYYEYAPRNGAVLVFFLVVAIVILVVGLILSGVHFYEYSGSKINLSYSLSFTTGSIITLISPIFWFFSPTTDMICQARLWSFSFGFSLILGTMFSRTWQLHEIYILTQQRGMGAIKYHISVKNSLHKLLYTLTIVFFVNLIMLALWDSMDPYHAVREIIDEVDLQAEWCCTSDHLVIWTFISLCLLIILISFGIYVIYQTWSFQKTVLLVETRWVLIALYNVILNIFALTPIFAFMQVTDYYASLLMIISIDFSAGGIICAVLLPKVFEKLDWSKKSTRESLNNSWKVRKPDVDSVQITRGPQSCKASKSRVIREFSEESPRKVEEPILKFPEESPSLQDERPMFKLTTVNEKEVLRSCASEDPLNHSQTRHDSPENSQLQTSESPQLPNQLETDDVTIELSPQNREN